jgi:uncharacterized protein with HEPN domain
MKGEKVGIAFSWYNLQKVENIHHDPVFFRNRIVDDYIGIDFGIVWEIRNNYLRKIIDMLNTL